jgi:hypothetical protein
MLLTVDSDYSESTAEISFCGTPVFSANNRKRDTVLEGRFGFCCLERGSGSPADLGMQSLVAVRQ